MGNRGCSCIFGLLGLVEQQIWVVGACWISDLDRCRSLGIGFGSLGLVGYQIWVVGCGWVSDLGRWGWLDIRFQSLGVVGGHCRV